MVTHRPGWQRVLPVCLSLLLFGFGQSRAQESEVDIRVSVLDDLTGEGLDSVVVYLDRVGGVEEFFPTRDIRLPEVSVGPLRIGFVRRGYAPRVVDLIVQRTGALVVRLVPTGGTGSEARGSRLSGTVRGSDNEPVPAALVRAVGRGPAVLTDTRGRFALDLPEGPQLIAAVHLGFRPELAIVAGESGSLDSLDVHMSAEAIPHEGIDVRVTSKRLAASGFYRRRGRGYRGRQFTEAEIRATAPNSLEELVEKVDGVRRIGGVAPTFQGRRDCRLKLFVDGMEMRDLRLDMIHPERVEAVEVWHGMRFTEVPPDFGCGAIVVWLK